jgi:cell division initiation protein
VLTPQDISEKEFVKAVFGGYEMAGVDGFLESLTEDYSALYKENAILKSKIKVLVEKVEEYRSTEDSMRMALLTAQKMGDDIVADANRKSAEIHKRAETEFEDAQRRLRTRMDDEEERLRAAAAQTEQFVNSSRELIRTYQDFLANLEQIHKHVGASVAAPTRTERIESAVREIDSNVEKLLSGEAEQAKRHRARDAAEESGEIDEPTSPRPRFAFDDLKFGVNFSDDGQ